MKKLIASILLIAMMTALLTGYSMTQANKVSYNVSQQADNFNVTRRLAVINARSDEPVFELIGNFALSNSAYNELEVIVETAPSVYKKHYVYLNDWTIYVVEDVSGAYVDPYHYEVNFLPEMIVPITFISED